MYYLGFMVMVILLLVALVILPLVFFVKKSTGYYLHYKQQLWIMCGYLLVLLFSPVTLALLPEEKFAEANMGTVSEAEFYELERAGSFFFSQMLEGRPEENDAVSIAAQRQFAFTGDRLTVVAPTFTSLFVERQDKAGGTIEVIVYATKTIVNLVDFSPVLKPPRVTLEESTLIIHMDHQVINVHSLRKESIVSQFFDPFQFRRRPFLYRTMIKHPMILLRIPVNLEIESGQPIYFVNQG